MKDNKIVKLHFRVRKQKKTYLLTKVNNFFTRTRQKKELKTAAKLHVSVIPFVFIS